MLNTLFLQRLRIVTHTGDVAYDERFHRGVNIIRGVNSSGKSTIVRFIFFVLGGYYTDFVPQAMKCRKVMAEVSIRGSVVTLKRYMEKRPDGKVNGQAPLYIYFGPMEEAMDPRNRNEWQKYPYVTTDRTTSFSNVLFDMLGYPQVKADSNITMHQILRLVYLDQESPVNSLFFYEPFDKEIYRETVANLLLGLYDQQYSNAKQELQRTIKAIAETKVSIKNVGEFLHDPKNKTSLFIRSYIDRLNEEIEQITQTVQDLRSNVVPEASKLKLSLEYTRIQTDIARQRKECVKLENEIKLLETEIEDSIRFVEHLEKRKRDLNNSIRTRDYIGTMRLDFCPVCLSPVDHNVEEGHCHLCKADIDDTTGKSQAMRRLIDLEFQIRESTQRKEENVQELDEKKAQLRRMRRQLNADQKHYDMAVGYVRSSHEERIDKLLLEKGFKEGEKLQYQTLLEQAEKYEALQEELQRLQKRQADLERYIAAAENRIKMNRRTIDKAVSDCGVYLLNNDKNFQEDFVQATELVLDYNQNMVYIPDRNNKLSASSAFYLKMVGRFALLLASIKVESMMYPRLLFSDNMEDKGLTEDRAVEFQKAIVRLLAEVPQENFQVIFATSMIAPELDDPQYTVGERYTGTNKSLKNVC